MEEEETEKASFDIPKGFDLDEFSSHIQNQYWLGFNSTTSLRQQFLDEDGQFNDQSEVRDRLVDYSFFSTHSALMARTYIDKPSITWENIWPWIDWLIAKNLNRAWKTDMETPEWARIIYQKEYDKYKYGAGTVLRMGWDGHNKKNTYTVIDPMLLIPDPDGDYIKGSMKFIGFEMEKFREELPSDFQNIQDLVDAQTELTIKRSQLRNNNGLQQNYTVGRFAIYACFSYYEVDGEDKLIYSIWGNERKTPLFIKIIEPELPEEKEDNFVPISRFVYTDNWKPKRDSYFGHRLAVFCLNVQNAKSLISTLRYQKGKAELYPMYIANTRMIPDRTDLDFGFNKVVFANPMEGESLDNVIKPMQKDFRADNSRLIDQDLDTSLTRVTGGMAGSIISGDETGRRETLGTTQLQQGNTDINLSLTTKISTWFYQNLAWGWYRGYIENFETGDKKIVELQTGLGTNYITLSKKDLLARVSISVKVQSYFEIKKKQDEMYIKLNQLNAGTATMNLPEVSRKHLLRDMSAASGIDEVKIDIYLWPSPQEQMALDENVALSKDIFVPINPEDDDLAHIYTHKNMGVDNKATAIHNQSHVQSYIAKWSAQTGAGMIPADQQAQKLQQSMAGQTLANQVASSNGQQGWTM